jgi:hypothetical protein
MRWLAKALLFIDRLKTEGLDQQVQSTWLADDISCTRQRSRSYA